MRDSRRLSAEYLGIEVAAGEVLRFSDGNLRAGQPECPRGGFTDATFRLMALLEDLQQAGRPSEDRRA